MGRRPDDDREQRLRALLAAHERACARFLVRRLPPDRGGADAADLLADVFTVVWRRLDDVPSPPADRAWILAVANHLVSHHERARWRRERLLSRLRREPATSPSAIDTTLSTAVDRALARLSPRLREALILVSWDGLSHQEAAEVLGCSVNTLTVRVHRARRRLRADLGALATDDPGARQEEQT